ncbi:MAG TPA: DUF2232 domain-containing protein [Stellaceae bacterium]|nr:DUF2232 domain-containing protein [Stellaceae bacterium]
MNRFKFASIAVGCGGLAACLYVAARLGTPGALVLVYMTQLPLFVAGLWLGAGAAAIAGLTGALVLLTSGDLVGAGIFVGLNALPVALLVSRALLARRAADATLSWYPPGLLAAWLTGLALAGMAVAVLVFGGAGGLEAALDAAIGAAFDRFTQVPPVDRDETVAMLAMIAPGMIAASWMATAIVNAALAQGMLARFGANWRPSPDLAGLALPLWLPAALGLGAAATLAGGAARFVGINVMLALLVPFCLAGLAVLHAAARRLPQPALALGGFYTIAALFGWPFLAVAVLGLLESWLGLRRRLAPPRNQVRN